MIPNKSKSVHKFIILKGARKAKKKKAGDLDESSDWSANDSGVEYGSAERISDGSDAWEGRSQELYDSDNPPDYPFNAYHLNSKPRILLIQDAAATAVVCLDIPCMVFASKEHKASALKKLELSYHDQKKVEALDAVDHRVYQQQERFGVPKPLVLHNLIGAEFIKGVMKNLTCPICQEMVNSPVIYKSCLHRFCSNCIETYNRQGKKECPLCRIAIGNRR